MVDSGFGRTDRFESGRWWRKPGLPAPEAENAEMRQPGALLGLVHAELPEAPVEIPGEPGSPLLFILANEHPHAARLSVADRCEPRALCRSGRLSQRSGNRVQLAAWTVAEKSQRDVQALAREDAIGLGGREHGLLPLNQPVEGGFRQAEADEEPNAIIAADASR